MKKRITLIFITLIMVFASVNTIYASEITITNFGDSGCISVPIYDSIDELEDAKESNAIEAYSTLAPAPGGTQLCYVRPFIVRSIGTDCELYFDFDSEFQISSVRFRELVVESEYIGKNFLKIGSASASYSTFQFPFSMYMGKHPIVRTFDIPTSENRVVVRTKGLGVYKNNPASWLNAQFQIGGWWKVS